MAVASSRITNLEPYSKRWRARFAVTFTDGRVIAYGPTQFFTEQAATDFLPTVEARVIENIQRTDAKDAVNRNVTVAHKEATRTQVNSAYLVEGIEAQDVKSAYKALKPIKTLLENSKTDAEIAAGLDLREKEIARARDRWTRLKARASEIEAYALVNIDG